MFKDDKEMQVTQEPDGTVRMIEKSVPQDLLNVQIGRISFDEEQKRVSPMYIPQNVLRFITHVPPPQKSK
jgi:hypothetical protein